MENSLSPKKIRVMKTTTVIYACTFPASKEFTVRIKTFKFLELLVRYLWYKYVKVGGPLQVSPVIVSPRVNNE